MINKDQAQIMAVLQYDVQGMNIANTAGNQSYMTTAGLSSGSQQNLLYTDTSGSLWQFWQNDYYPRVIRESYPVYIQERSMDKGKQAFEILKALMDQGLVKIDKVKDFILAMDTLLKTL